MGDLVRVSDLRCLKIITPCLLLSYYNKYAPLLDLVTRLKKPLRWTGHPPTQICKIDGEFWVSKEAAFYYETGYLMTPNPILGSLYDVNRFYFGMIGFGDLVQVPTLGIYKKENEAYRFIEKHAPSKSGVDLYKLDLRTKLVILKLPLPNDIIRLLFEYVEFANFRLEEDILKIGKFEYQRKGFKWQVINPEFRSEVEKLIFGDVIPRNFLWEDNTGMKKLRASHRKCPGCELCEHFKILFTKKRSYNFRSLERVIQDYSR